MNYIILHKEIFPFFKIHYKIKDISVYFSVYFFFEIHHKSKVSSVKKKIKIFFYQSVPLKKEGKRCK